MDTIFSKEVIMRGINISSLIFLLTIIWNIISLAFLSYKKKTTKHKSSTIHILIFFILNIVLISCLFYFSINISISHYSIKSERLPSEFDGYKIIQISDFHTASFYGGTTELVKKVKREKPDIIVLTGDLIDEEVKTLRSVRELSTQLVRIAPVYSISGNHDIWYNNFSGLEEMLTDNGVILLDNRKELLSRGNSHINLYGIADPNSWTDSNKEQQFLKNKISSFEKGFGYNILLFHRADMFDIIKGNGFQLVFSGHMHGGQLQIPFLGGLISPTINRRWFPKYTDGKWEAAGTVMIVSRGLGNNVSVPRLLNPPDLVSVTLKSQ